MAVTQSQIKEQEGKVKAARKAIWKERLFSHKRRLAELAYKDAVIELRKLKAQYRYEKRNASAGGGSASKVDTDSASAASGLNDAQIASLIAAINGLMAQGESEVSATNRVVAVYPPAVQARMRRALMLRRPQFRPVPGEVARPARSLDPVVVARGINPRARAHRLDRFYPGRSIDPVPPGIAINDSSGAFQFAPQAAVAVDQAIEEQNEIEMAAAEAAVTPWYMSKHLWLAGGVVALLIAAGSRKSRITAAR